MALVEGGEDGHFAIADGAHEGIVVAVGAGGQAGCPRHHGYGRQTGHCLPLWAYTGGMGIGYAARAAFARGFAPRLPPVGSPWPRTQGGRRLRAAATSGAWYSAPMGRHWEELFR